MAKRIILPTSVDDLSRVGLLFLARRLGATRRDILHARLQELETVASAAFDAWKASLPEAQLAMERYHQLLTDKGSYTQRGEKILRQARDAHEAADRKKRRLDATYRRADAAVSAFWKSGSEPEAGA